MHLNNSPINIKTPKTLIPNEYTKSNFPILIKPRHGSAGKNIFKVHDQKELEFYVPRIKDPIIQEIINGSEVTTDVICDYQGSILGIVNRERLEVRWGEVSKGNTIFDKKKRYLNFHFDLMHGRNNLNKAIDLLDSKNKEDFRKFVNTEVSFNPQNMYICKSELILKNYYEDLFPWLEKCEKLFGF